MVSGFTVHVFQWQRQRVCNIFALRLHCCSEKSEATRMNSTKNAWFLLLEYFGVFCPEFKTHPVTGETGRIIRISDNLIFQVCNRCEFSFQGDSQFRMARKIDVSVFFALKSCICSFSCNIS